MPTTRPNAASATLAACLALGALPAQAQSSSAPGAAGTARGAAAASPGAAGGSPGAAAGSPGAPEAVLPSVDVEASADASAAGLSRPYAGGQVARGARAGLLGTQDYLELPFSATAYTQALIRDQQARSVADVLQSDPSVRVTRGFGNFQELYVIRGFALFSDDLAYNGLYGLLPRQFVSTELLERVEVLRGASAFLNGAAPGGSGIGGSINLLPKRAPGEPLSLLTLGVESGGQGHAAADVARRFGPDGAGGIRFNAARRDGATAVDRENRTLDVLALGLDWRGRGVRLSADAGYQDHRLRRARPSVTLDAGVPVPAAPGAERNFSQPWSFSNGRDTFGTLRGELDLGASATAWAAFGARRGTESASLANPRVTAADGTTSASRFDNFRKDSVETGEVGVRARLRTGPVEHLLSASAATFRLKSRNAFALSDFAGFASSLYAPVDVAAPAADAFTGGTLGAPLVTQRTRTASVALADTMSFAQDRVRLTLGARRQKIEDNGYDFDTGAQTAGYDRSRLTPVAGLVVRPSERVSLYANYIEGLARGPVAGGTAVNAGEVFAPFRSKQKEVGLKYDADRLGASFALFSTGQPNGLLDPATNRFGISGEQRNRGAELLAFGQPARGVRVLGGVTLLDAEQVRTAGGAFDGNRAIGVPRTQANLGAEWDVPGVEGFTLTGRVVHTSAQYADAANTQRLPAWTRLDVGARYLMDVGGRLLVLRARIDNLANRAYWASAGGFPGATGYLVLGAPRTLTVTASLEF